MANFNIFSSKKTDTRNEAGGRAYTLSPKQQLAQLAATGCFNDTFYASAETQLEQILNIAQKIEPLFIAKTAIYARERGYMKDMPALLLAMLAERDVALCAQIFNQVIDNGKMLRNFAQMVRSGVTGRKSFGTRPKKLIQQWLLSANEKQLLQAAIGNKPSLADVVKMVHPKPREAWRAAWFAWLIGKPYERAALPPLTRTFEDYKSERSGKLPDVPFQLLTALELDTAAWTQIARNGSWQQVRQSLNTFARHGVFQNDRIVRHVAAKLADASAIAKARVMPYQLLTAYQATDSAMPHAIREALQDAMEIAVQNVPRLAGNVIVCPDVSGSMNSSVTGYRSGATSTTRCVDVAALISAAVLRHNPQARVLPFEMQVAKIELNPRDSIMTNAQKMAKLCGGGTACSAPLAWLNREKAPVDLLLMISDNESWADVARGKNSAMLAEWDKIKARCPQAKLVCLDIQPYATVQAHNRHDILNIGGFSDQVFHLLGAFVAQNNSADFWVEMIEKIQIAELAAEGKTPLPRWGWGGGWGLPAYLADPINNP